jgi:hypothetical protein
VKFENDSVTMIDTIIAITHTRDPKKAPRKRKRRDKIHIMIEFGGNLSFKPHFIAMYFLVFLKLFPW